jgi:hypothetical protein
MTSCFAALIIWLVLNVAMPAPRGRKNPFRRDALRRRNGRKVFGPGRNLAVPRNIKVIPAQMMTSFKYNVFYDASQGFPLSPNSVYFQFIGNSAYAPDLNTVTEFFPTGVPQFAALYQQYQVAETSIRVQLSAIGPIASTVARFCIFAHPYTTALPGGATQTEDFQGQPMCSRIVNFGPVSGASLSTPLRVTRRTTQILGRPASQCHAAPDLSGRLLGSSPTTQWFFTVVVANSTGVLAVDQLKLQITLDMRVRLFQPSLFQPQSFEPVVISHNIKDLQPCDFRCPPSSIVEIFDDEMKDEQDVATSAAAAVAEHPAKIPTCSCDGMD